MRWQKNSGTTQEEVVQNRFTAYVKQSVFHCKSNYLLHQSKQQHQETSWDGLEDNADDVLHIFGVFRICARLLELENTACRDLQLFEAELQAVKIIAQVLFIEACFHSGGQYKGGHFGSSGFVHVRHIISSNIVVVFQPGPYAAWLILFHCLWGIAKFLQQFIQSGIAEQIENGNPKYVAGKSGLELLCDVLEITSGKKLDVAFMEAYDRSDVYWVGWVLAHYQWYSFRRFRDILEVIPYNELLGLYSTLHEADVHKAYNVYFYVCIG